MVQRGAAGQTLFGISEAAAGGDGNFSGFPHCGENSSNTVTIEDPYQWIPVDLDLRPLTFPLK